MMTLANAFHIDKILRETWDCILENETEPIELTKDVAIGSSTEVNEYIKRLSTYDFYTQPIAISPIICSYFGWKKSLVSSISGFNNEDPIALLQCVDCKCYLAIEFHPQLTEESSRSLLQKYRRMLATSHTKNCSFRAKSERWLGAKDSNEDHSGEKGSNAVNNERLVSVDPSLESILTTRSSMTTKCSTLRTKSLWAGSISSYSLPTDSAREDWPTIMEVPMYLLPMSTEYTLLQLTEIDSPSDPTHASINYSWKHHDVYYYLQSRASSWMGKMQTIPSERHNFKLSLIHLNWDHLFPPKVLHFIKSLWLYHVPSAFNSSNSETQIKNALSWFYKFLINFSGYKNNTNGTDALNNHELDIHLDISILTLFGWRHAVSSTGFPCNDFQDESMNNCAYCPICLAKIKLPRIVKSALLDVASPIAISETSRLHLSERKIGGNLSTCTETAADSLHIGTQRKRALSFDHYTGIKGSSKPSPPKRIKFTEKPGDPLDEDEVWNSKISQISQSIASNLRWSESFHLVDNHRYYCPYASGFVSEIMFPDRTDAAWECLLSSLLLFDNKLDSISRIEPRNIFQIIRTTFDESFCPNVKTNSK